jgi:hypothetical protein
VEFAFAGMPASHAGKEGTMKNDGLTEIRYEGIHCHFTIARPASGIIVVRISGWDAGEFGELGEIMRIYTDPAAFDTALIQTIYPSDIS